MQLFRRALRGAGTSEDLGHEAGGIVVLLGGEDCALLRAICVAAGNTVPALVAPPVALAFQRA